MKDYNSNTNSPDRLRNNMDRTLCRMKDQIDALLSKEFDKNGIDCTPMFNMAKCTMLDAVVSDFKLAILSNNMSDIGLYKEELEDILKMQL
jgi:hypothetical protein